MKKLSAIVMAAGFSRRMGVNKLLLELGGKTLLEWVLEAVATARVCERILVAMDDEILRIGASRGFQSVYNQHPELGQSVSVKLGVLAADKSSDYFFFAADQPFITDQLIDSLICAHNNSEKKITVPVVLGERSSPVIFPNSFRDKLLKLEGDYGGRGLISANIKLLNCVEISDEKPLRDIDTPKDFKTVSKWLAEGRWPIL